MQAEDQPRPQSPLDIQNGGTEKTLWRIYLILSHETLEVRLRYSFSGIRYDKKPYCGSTDGAVVRALASHQCGPGSIPGVGVICGLSLLLVLVPAPRVFLRGPRFSSLHKNQHFQIPIRPGNSGEKSHSVDSTEIPIYLFFIYFYLIQGKVYR